jgi:hypothetical protein
MAIFSKTKKLPDLRSRRDNLQTRLAAAETTLDGLRNDAVALASDDPGKLSDKAEAAWRIEFEIAALRTAIQKASDEIAAAEEAERIAADRAEREATARVANAMAAAIEKAAVPVPGVVQAFLEAVEAAAPVIGSTGMPDFLRNLMRELPAAAETLAATARARAARTLVGSAPASLPKPWTPEIVPLAPGRFRFFRCSTYNGSTRKGSARTSPHTRSTLYQSQPRSVR